MMKKIVLNLSELAEVTGFHRQTIAKRLSNVRPISGSSCKCRNYGLKTALAAIYSKK
ncbi:DUF1441 family protein [Klebsiella quasipneumoniae subsp. similipneumoniae]|nr:DUF1441 family protein [Klebsiella quasipneumoniae]TBO74958.1 DUF1441 family protein [Klebsiella quasipneumoniae subsp. similipneumoniae]PUH04145.1 hypothetical protein DBL00_03495 [Klebsiella quasipneumoniae]TBO79017.1 DUF1441 family protein [Klebsiella quasipneumoniae subsp. similipneumoniae]TBO89937.1 DUF1441 family protein [Klebsiella quasipneumoniae subsp. similipneumoniae]